MLEISELETGYRKKQVLFGVSLDVQEDEVVGLIGPNGAGKSTVLKAVCGLIPVWKGRIQFDGRLTTVATPAQNITRGITFVPQGNRVFDELTVIENLEIGAFHLPGQESRKRIDEVLQIFPILKERVQQIAGELSSGEQQILALARALVPKPRLLMLDEPSHGLSPSLVDAVFRKVLEISRGKRVAILIVEQKVREVLEICTRVYSLKLGKIAYSGHPSELKEDKERLKQLFL